MNDEEKDMRRKTLKNLFFMTAVTALTVGMICKCENDKKNKKLKSTYKVENPEP